jgi:nitrogen-specific signal transduction histidine kinase
MADYVTEHFGARHWGDLYARNGDWARAFVHYGELEGDETVRPSTAEDRLEVELTIRSLSASLYAEIHNGSEAVQRLFARACRYILGYQEVAFWVYQQPQWRLDTPEEPPWGLRSLLKKAENFLPAIGCTSVGPLPLPDPWNRLAVAASLPGPPPCRQRALVLSNFKSETVVSRERERLTLELLQHFLVAYQHALGIELDRERLAMRETQAEVINSIFGTLGSHLLDVDDALMQAASGLRRSGYSRVLFSLVTPTQDRIQGELEDADDPRVDVARMTDWPLDDPKADLQPYVVHSRRPRVVEDAAREPLANVDMVAKAQMKALAIVPLLDREGHAIGTVHVERRDRGVPSTDEVSDLLHFGKQLAIAIQQIQRLKMLQAALDRIPEPVMIVDRSMQLRFTNAPAAALLAQKPGWYERRDLQTLSESQLGMVRRLASESLERGQRLVRQITELGSGQPYRGVALADAIMDWKERTVGAVLHLQDLSYLYSVFAAFRLIAESEDTKSALEATLRAAELLGHERGRLLLIDEDDPERLIGILTLDSGGRILSDSPTNKVLLPRRGDPEFRTWDCIENRSPMVACWNDEHDNRSQIITGFGLEATNARPPRCPHEIAKEPGDFWIDLPLLTRYSVLGKLTLSCDPHLKPEDFHLLRLLAEMAAGLLDAFIRRDRTERELDKKVLGPLAEQAMAVTAHSIATRLGSLPLLVTRYRLFERQLPGLKEVNNSFEHTVEEVLQTVRRFKERLASVHVEPVRTDLRQLVTVPLRELLSEQQWKISGSHTCLEVDVDQHLLENALLELIQNAREMIPSEEDLFVEVSLDVVHAFDGEAVQLSITDNGPGIPDNLKARVFEPFFSRRPGRRNKSSGVGLAFVQRVVKGHGGTIEVADAAGSGARFVLTLPRFT